MSLSPRIAALSVFALALATVAQAQNIPFQVNPNQYVGLNTTARQAAYNMAVLGNGLRQIPPYAYGYNPYPSPVYANSPLVTNGVPLAAANPYALSTVASTNPYMSSAALGTSPYSLSTAGGSGGLGYQPYYSPYGYGYQDPYGAAFQGLASLTSATGQYYIATMQARIIREQARQATIDTAKKQLEFEAWYETVRPTAPKMIALERATDLDRARKGSPASEIWSGKALNDLLASVLKEGSGRLKDGPNVPLEDETLKHLNLSPPAGGGNAGLLRKLLDKDYHFNWPEVLSESKYEKLTKDLETQLRSAANDVYQSGEGIATDKKNNIRATFDAITKQFNESADELAPSQYIESKRFLNQVKAAIRALSDTSVKNYLNKNNTWNAKGKNVAELVDHMSKTGLMFTGAADGDYAAYNAAYIALRQFEAGLASGR